MKKSLVLCFLFLITVALASSCQDRDDHLAGLRAAEVPVHPLAHNSSDPTAAFPESFPMQVAVFWSNRDESTLGLTHALSEMGIPFFVTRDLDQALRHRLVILYPTIEGATFNEQQVNKLTHAVSGGASVLAFNVFAGGLKPLFGFTGYAPSRRRYEVKFDSRSDTAEKYLNRPEEQRVPLGAASYGDIFWTNGYTPDDAAVSLARFEDRSDAILRKKTGKGTTYLIGLSYQDVLLRSQLNRDYDAGRHYVNAFEPGADVWMLFLRGWYESRQPDAVRLATIPNGQSSAVLLSHDVDWENSFDPALKFSEMEEKHLAKSSFLIQTKYVNDANSASFFYGKDLEDLKQLYSRGFTIGSHSVIHSRAFNKFDLGSGTETLATYRPKGTGFASATGATVIGEVRVSKELLDGQLPGQQTILFRAGHLRVPGSLPEALQRCGYRFDSSFTAGDVLTNFPYALTLELGFREDSSLYEFPIMIEDEEAPSMEQRVNQALEVIRANAENGAVTVVLIHPNEAVKKLQAEDLMLSQLSNDVVAMDLIGFAAFWRARDHLKWNIVPLQGDAGVQLAISTDEPVDGLTFEFQRNVASVEGNAKLLDSHQQVVLPALRAGEHFALSVRFSK